MKSNVTVLLILCCAVSIAQTLQYSRSKRDDHEDRWIWGYVEDKNSNNKTENRNAEKKMINSTKTPFDPSSCPVFDSPKPSFKVRGRRISEEKCEEYKWYNTVNEAQERTIECISKLESGYIPPVVGGRSTLSGEFPHMGALGWKASATDGYVFKCGSTLISPKFILTAAHCSKAPSYDTSIADIVPKIDKIDGFTEDLKISRIIVHPNYKPPKKYFDIALMELQFEVIFSPLMHPACLWTKADMTELGKKASVTGWGVLHSGSQDISPELQVGVVDIINNSFCDQLLLSVRNRNWLGLQEHQLCAVKLAGGVDACQGDSGGPLQVKQLVEGSENESMYYVVGVTSFGIDCALPNYPGVYTRVSSFIDWIESHVWT